MELPEGWGGGVQTQNPLWEKYGYFVENTTWLHIVPVAVVWCGPHREDCLIKMPLVSFHNQLMSSADQVNVICCIKLSKEKKLINYY